jgi:hypothetical protein
VVAVYRLTDGLEPDRLGAQARDRQRPGHRAGRDDDVVVGDLPPRADQRLDGGDLAGVLDAGHLAGEYVAAPQRAAQRHHRMARRDATGRRLRQERLVRHVWLRVDDRHLGPGWCELAGQSQGHVQPDVTGSDDQDPLRLHDPIVPQRPALEQPGRSRRTPVSAA